MKVWFENQEKENGTMAKIKMTTPIVEMDGDEMTRIPVSYTHLDVYKRQDPFSIRWRI